MYHGEYWRTLEIAVDRLRRGEIEEFFEYMDELALIKDEEAANLISIIEDEERTFPLLTDGYTLEELDHYEWLGHFLEEEGY